MTQINSLSTENYAH